MSHSLISADRNTHLKMIAVALVSAIVLVGFGLLARMDSSEIATARLHSPVLKAGPSATVTLQDRSTIR
jgi:hypothetical protein